MALVEANKADGLPLYGRKLGTAIALTFTSANTWISLYQPPLYPSPTTTLL
jgi:hypothetical protein